MYIYIYIYIPIYIYTYIHNIPIYLYIVSHMPGEVSRGRVLCDSRADGVCGRAPRVLSRSPPFESVCPVI